MISTSSIIILLLCKCNACIRWLILTHSVEIGYGISPEFERNGYTTEAVTALVQWAHSQPDVIFVEAEAAPENTASLRVLEKCKFVPNGQGEEGPRFVVESELPSWMSVYMLFGLSIGTALGTANDHIGVGTCLGICIGMLIGIALDSSAKKERGKIRKEFYIT